MRSSQIAFLTTIVSITLVTTPKLGMSMAAENVTDAAAENVTLGRGDEPQFVAAS